MLRLILEGFFGAFGEHFTTVGGDRKSMFPLRGKASVTRGDSPAVGLIQLGMMGAGIEHGLDSKGHAFLEYQPSAWLAIVKHLGVFVKDPADTMTTILPDDRVIVGDRKSVV